MRPYKMQSLLPFSYDRDEAGKTVTRWLPMKPFIAWDYDDTLSHNRVTISNRMAELIVDLEDKGIEQVIVTGRHPTKDDSHMGFDGGNKYFSMETLSYISARNLKVDKKYYNSFNSIRFKLWVLRHPIAQQYMIIYVDNDEKVCKVLKSANIPAISLAKHPPEHYKSIISSWIDHYTKRRSADRNRPIDIPQQPF